MMFRCRSSNGRSSMRVSGDMRQQRAVTRAGMGECKRRTQRESEAREDCAFEEPAAMTEEDFDRIGSSLTDACDWVGAKTAFEHALRVNEKKFGPRHPSVS